MRMCLVIPDFPFEQVEQLTARVNTFAPCNVQYDGKNVSVSCEADLVKCMEVISVTDLFQFYGGEKNENSTEDQDVGRTLRIL